MKKRVKQFGSILLLAIPFLISSCGLFGGGGSTETNGFLSDLVPGTDTVLFDVSSSATVYHAVY